MHAPRIIRLIKNGDKRSVAGVGRAVALIRENPSLIKDLFDAISLDNEALNMRALDAIEKATRHSFDLLTTYKNIIINDLLHVQQKEIRWHIAQMLPRLSLTKKELKRVIEVLTDEYLNDKSSIVKTNTLQALHELAASNPDLIQQIKPIIKQAAKSGAPAMMVRAKKLLMEELIRS